MAISSRTMAPQAIMPIFTMGRFGLQIGVLNESKTAISGYFGFPVKQLSNNLWHLDLAKN